MISTPWPCSAVRRFILSCLLLRLNDALTVIRTALNHGFATGAAEHNLAFVSQAADNFEDFFLLVLDF